MLWSKQEILHFTSPLVELWFFCFSTHLHSCRAVQGPSYAVLIDSKRWQSMSFHVPFSLSPPQSGVSDPSLGHIWVKLSFVNSNSISLSVFLVSCIPSVFHLLIKKDLFGALLLLLGIPTVFYYSFYFFLSQKMQLQIRQMILKFQWNISKTRLNIWCGQWILSPGLPILFSLHCPHASVMISTSSDLCLNYHHM